MWQARKSRRGLMETEMTRLKDICLQVRYEGAPSNLISDFFEVVGDVSSEYRVYTSSLNQENLLPISLGLSRFLACGKNVRMLIVSNVPQDVAVGTSDAVSGQEPKLLADLLAQITPLAAAAEKQQQPDLRILAEHFEVRIASSASANVTALESPSAAVGVFTDQAGLSVLYQTDPALASSDGLLSTTLAVSWSWGDPQFKVQTITKEFESMWANAGAGSGNIRPDSALSLALLKTLLFLEQHPEVESKTEEGFKLFPHQQAAVEAWESRAFKGVFKMCTGAGKTISALAGVRVLSQHCGETSRRLPPVVVSVPTRVLADQWIREIKRFGFRSVLPAYNAFEQWNHLLEPTLRVQNSDLPRFIVTTYRSFADERFIDRLQRAFKTEVEALWIADEMHNLASPRLQEAMKQVSGLFRFRLGLSATPEIEGDLTTTEHLLNYFGNICASYELHDGIRDGVLCPYRYYPIPAYLAPDLGAKYLRLLQEITATKASSPTLMNLYRETRELLRTSGVQVARFRDLLQSLLQSAPNLCHTLIYCPPGYGSYGGDISDEIDTDLGERRLIEEVITVLRDNGLSASSILGETPADQRAQILGRFADGRINVLCAIGCLDEGVDVPSIQRAIVLYSVDREKQFIQRRGRILRQPKGIKGKIAEIHDIVILPHGSDIPAPQAEALLNKELRRYRQFAGLALNRQEADDDISTALSIATRSSH